MRAAYRYGAPRIASELAAALRQPQPDVAVPMSKQARLTRRLAAWSCLTRTVLRIGTGIVGVFVVISLLFSYLYGSRGGEVWGGFASPSLSIFRTSRRLCRRLVRKERFLERALFRLPSG